MTNPEDYPALAERLEHLYARLSEKLEPEDRAVLANSVKAIRHAPVRVSPENAYLSVSLAGVTVSVWHARFDGSRNYFGYIVRDDADNRVLLQGDDLGAPAQHTPWNVNLPAVLRTLLTFIEDWAQSEDCDDTDLFPGADKDAIDWTDWCIGVRAHLVDPED